MQPDKSAGVDVTRASCHLNPVSVGKHTIDIDLQKLPASTVAMYFAVSAWTHTLHDIKRPWIRFYEHKTGMELCRYNHEDFAKAGQTSVLMCKLQRAPLRPTQWEVHAIGSPGKGCAKNYGPIQAKIAAHLKTGTVP